MCWGGCVCVITELRASQHDEPSEDGDRFTSNERIHARLALQPSPCSSLRAEIQKKPLVLCFSLISWQSEREGDIQRGILACDCTTGISGPGQDAGVIRVHGPPLDEPQCGRASEPAERQQPERRHTQQVQSRCYGGTQPWATVRPERAILQRSEREDRHEV